jgi:copper chaperone
METITLEVEGMSCDACVKHVTQALMGLDGVASARVSLDEHHAVVTYEPTQVAPAQMVAAIEEEGYEAAPEPH